jgi:hypothetical protein
MKNCCKFSVAFMYGLGKCPGAKVPGQHSSANSYNCNKMTPIIRLSLFMDVMWHRLVLIY